MVGVIIFTDWIISNGEWLLMVRRGDIGSIVRSAKIVCMTYASVWCRKHGSECSWKSVKENSELGTAVFFWKFR